MATLKKILYRVCGKTNIRRVKTFFFRWPVVVKRWLSNERNGISFLVLGNPDQHVFFGYYDLCPFNDDETLVLAHRTASANKPSPRGTMQVGYYDLAKREFVEVAQTRAWCWQQGCRLQWFSEEAIIFNQRIEDSYGSVIQRIDSRQIEKAFPYPIYDINRQRSLGFGLNFERLQEFRPGYGYAPLSAPQSSVESDSIYSVDLVTGEYAEVLSLGQVMEVSPLESMRNATHYFNHISCSPFHDRLLAVHQWTAENGKRHGRLLTMNYQGENLRLLNNLGHTSHYCWMSEDEILSYSTEAEGTGFYIYHECDGGRSPFAAGVMREDGHPSFCGNGSFVLCDTYPDKLGEQEMYLYFPEVEEKVSLLRLYSPPSFSGEIRCDLHPRLSRSGNLVAFDIPIRGRRVLGLVNIREILDERA